MDKFNYMKTIGERLRYARENFGIQPRMITQQELSILSGINSMQISHFECNERKPSCTNVIRLCEALGISSDWLLNIQHKSK